MSDDNETQGQGGAPQDSAPPAQSTPPAPPVDGQTGADEQKPAASDLEKLSEALGGGGLLDEVKGEDGAKTSEATPPAAPEAYTAFTDEQGREFDAESLGEFAVVAKELGLSQENAQKMFSAMRPSMQGVFIREVKERNEEWKQAARTDSEYGGERFDANMAYAKAAYDRYASPELRKVFAATGLGNNPEIIRLFYRVGKAISPDPGVSGTPSTMQEPRRRFPNSNMNPD